MMLAVQPIMKSAFSPYFSYNFLPPVQNIQIHLNENPMYIDEEGQRHLDEPLYQAVIRVPSTGMVMYEYFDASTPVEAVEFINQLVEEYRARGCRWVSLSSHLSA